MSTKILVLGSRGMLGHMVLRVLSEENSLKVDGTHRADSRDRFYFDAGFGMDALLSICRTGGKYDYLVNCIGLTKDRIEERNSQSVVQSIRINALFPHDLADLAERQGSRVIQISTDGVFSGKAEAYDEDAPHDCSDVYGKTKSLGEIINSNVLNIRCSIIGPSPFQHRGLLEWFLSQPEGSLIPGYTNQFWGGVSTVQFAELCKAITKQSCFDALRRESPVFHFTPNIPISKYELLNLFKSAFRRNVSIIPREAEGGVVHRVLVSKYLSLRDLCGYDLPMESAIKELTKFV